jgi:hypothetical protein
VVTAAAAAGAEVVALTDHDTVDGLDEAAAAADARSVPLIRGAELAVDWRGAEVHLLVLGVGPAWALPDAFAAAHRFRERRVRIWLDRCTKLFPGFDAPRCARRWDPTRAPYAGVVLAAILAEARRVDRLTEARWDVPTFAAQWFGAGAPLGVPEEPLPPLEQAVPLLAADILSCWRTPPTASAPSGYRTW